ncbi:hypothetical protein [Pseudomonas sp. NPDC087639]|uniref:hypothetical protein n=1 Tax=Pseudomonas sp. NPDC087639 TaxID=3364445 RepID=UPI00381B8BC8
MRNKPKATRQSTTGDTSGISTPRSTTPDNGSDDLSFNLPGRIRPDGSSETTSGVRVETTTGGTLHPEPAVTVSPIADIATTQRTTTTSPLERYVQHPGSELSAPDAAGLRLYKNKKFLDVADETPESGIQTVMVEFDEAMKAYRAKLPAERKPSGPPLYRIAESNTWSLQKPIEYYDYPRYTSSYAPDTRGYYAVHEKVTWPNEIAGLPPHSYENRDVGFAVKDERDRLIRVDPLMARGDTSLPLKLAHWTDGDIWNVYRLRETEALVFRSEADAHGRAPDWARRFDEPNIHKYLTDSLRWSHPQKSLTERADILRTYNLSIAQQNRLRADMEDGVFPEWAEQHKRLTQSNDDQRFKQIAEELEPYILRLRNEGERLRDSLPDVEERYESEFLNRYLEHAGYKRNVHGFIYRTDIPAMFRADLRTPFELARDERLVKLRGNPSDSTTKRAFSATFSLADGLNYMGFNYYSNPRHYNSQANRYPGHLSDSDSSSGRRHSTDGESDTSFEMDDSRDYPLLRREQKLGFLYVIDTRGIEVVPQAENIYLNNMHFLGDTLEGRISMPTRGISAERIWLVQSDLKRAARVEDIFREADEDADGIEKATWAGTDASAMWRYGYTPYDELINRVADTGGVILDLQKGEHTFANDIVWPVPEHYRP